MTDSAFTPPYPSDGRQRGQDAPDDGLNAARGFVIGAIVGLRVLGRSDPAGHRGLGAGMKLCECGCDQPAPIAKWNDKRTGAIKGQPQRFLKGHQNRGKELPRKSLAERFWPKVDVRGQDECWPWVGFLRPSGYGEIGQGDGRHGRYFLAHRVAYELTFGAIPADHPEPGRRWTVDHACHNTSSCVAGDSCHHRACCNPRHLELVSDEDNTMRGKTIAARNRAKTHCVNGHEFTSANTMDCHGNRNCRECHNDANRRYRARAAAPAA